MSEAFWGAQLLSVCNPMGCSPWPGMGRVGIQFCTPNSDMKPVLVLSQEKNAVYVSKAAQVPAVSNARLHLHLFQCPLGFRGSLLLAATTSGHFMLQQLKSIPLHPFSTPNDRGVHVPAGRMVLFPGPADAASRAELPSGWDPPSHEDGQWVSGPSGAPVPGESTG